MSPIHSISKSKKSGISKPIVCSKCGKVVGTVSLKAKFNRRLIIWGVVIAIGIEIVAQLTAQMLLGNNPSFIPHLLFWT